MERTWGGRVLRLVQGELARQAADALVSAASPGLRGGPGVDGALHRAGGPAIAEECRVIHGRMGDIPPGGAVVTGAGDLPARHVVHAVVAPAGSGAEEDERVLRQAYRSSLSRCEQVRARTVAFPSLGTGAHGLPVAKAAPAALDEVARFLERDARHVEEVRLVLASREDFDAYAAALAAL